MQMGAHGGAEAAGVERTQPRLGLCRRRSARRPPRRWHSLRRSLQQLQILAAATGRQDPCSTRRARATAERGRPVRMVSQGRCQKAHAAAAQQTGFACVLSLGAPLLDVPEQHGKDSAVQWPGSSKPFRRAVVGVAFGGWTRRGALGRAPCYRGVSKREAAVHLAGATSPHPTWCTLWSRL